MTNLDSAKKILLKVNIQSKNKSFFIDWQSKLNKNIVNFPGFISLDILSPHDPGKQNWMILQSFEKEEDARRWQNSTVYCELIEELQEMLGKDEQIEELQPADQSLGVTEVIVAEVNPSKEREYREWLARIHQIEASFPGFRGTYVQSPREGQGKNWITLLQFDTHKNLDNWLTSEERKNILKDSESLITSLETHRVESPYAGWFSSLTKDGEIPPVWKQTMLVLLVLFPIVMLELKFLSPLTAGLNFSLATFIGNAISVSLIAWPLMPIAIWFLHWWLVPKGNKTAKTIIGTIIVILLYLLEVLVFSKVESV